VNVKTETVQFMADLKLPDKIIQSTVARILIAALQTVLGSLVLLLTFLVRHYVDILILKYTVVLAIGLLAGFSARRFLDKNTRTLRLLTALISAALSLAILFLISNGFLGINLLFQLNRTPDWQGLIQFVIAVFGAWLVLTAFRTAPVIKDLPTPAPPPQSSTSLSKPGFYRWLPKLKLPPRKITTAKVSRPILEKKKPLSVGKSGAQKKSRTLTKGKSAKKPSSAHKLTVAPVKKIKKPARPKRKRVRKKPVKEIKFIGIEEHRCPYCLDLVEPHDPRGVKICSVCKTHHHKDCWGITGACQIPHSQK
jgi:protein-S-isoprenylcysteine O-methyltransferase Ste14